MENCLKNLLSLPEINQQQDCSLALEIQAYRFSCSSDHQNSLPENADAIYAFVLIAQGHKRLYISFMKNYESQWENYQQIIRWFEAKYRKKEISKSVYIAHVGKAARMMQEMVIQGNA